MCDINVSAAPDEAKMQDHTIHIILRLKSATHVWPGRPFTAGKTRETSFTLEGKP